MNANDSLRERYGDVLRHQNRGPIGLVHRWKGANKQSPLNQHPDQYSNHIYSGSNLINLSYRQSLSKEIRRSKVIEDERETQKLAIQDGIISEDARKDVTLHSLNLNSPNVLLNKTNESRNDESWKTALAKEFIDNKHSESENINFLKSTEFESINVTLKASFQSKQRRNTISKRSKKIASKRKDPTILMPVVTESEPEDYSKKENGKHSPTSYRKIMEERNTERLRAAYEARERARILILERLKEERKRIDEYVEKDKGQYSQYLKKFIIDKQSITIFKRMDNASLETRRQKIQKGLITNRMHNYSQINNQTNHVDQNSDKQSLPFLGQTITKDEVGQIDMEIVPPTLHQNIDQKVDKSANEGPVDVNNSERYEIQMKSSENKLNNFQIEQRNKSIEVINKGKENLIVKNNYLIEANPVTNTDQIGEILTKELPEEVSSLIENDDTSQELLFYERRLIRKLCNQISSAQSIYDRFEVSKELGDGNFAVVKLAVQKDNNRQYALKVISKFAMTGREYMLKNEVVIMTMCDHRNIIKLKEVFESPEELFLLMELIKSGDLYEGITKNKRFTEPVASEMVSDMANGLFYLHSCQIVHRDIKPENIMVKLHRNGSMTLKITDFGLAMEAKKPIFTVCGTATYVAPEILSEKGYSIEVDVWALGVIAYILLCGYAPFQSRNGDHQELFQIIQRGYFTFLSPYWDKISQDVKELIRKMLDVDHRSRYTTIEVLTHRWIMSKGLSIVKSEENSQTKTLQLKDEAKMHLEHFQRKKKELYKSVLS